MAVNGLNFFSSNKRGLTRMKGETSPNAGELDSSFFGKY